MAEEKFTQALKADKKFVLNKKKAAQVKLEKMAKLKALRLAKELANLHGINWGMNLNNWCSIAPS